MDDVNQAAMNELNQAAQAARETPEPMKEPQPFAVTGSRVTWRIATRGGGLLFETDTAKEMIDAVAEAYAKGVNLSHAAFRAPVLVMRIQGSRDSIIVFGELIKIGCQKHNLSHWLARYEEIGSSNGYSPELIAEYGAHLRHIAALIDLKKAYGAAKAKADNEKLTASVNVAAAAESADREASAERAAARRFQRYAAEALNMPSRVDVFVGGDLRA
jgi:hypothetical protein